MADLYTADRLEPGCTAEVVSVDGDDALSRLAEHMGIKPGLQLTALGFEQDNEVYRFESSSGDLELPLDMCQRIWVST